MKTVAKFLVLSLVLMLSACAATKVPVDNTDVPISTSVEHDTEIENSSAEAVGLPKPETLSEPDEYYWGNSTVLEVIDASEATDVLTEAEAISLLRSRGFTEHPVTYEYSLSGDYYGQTEALADSSTKRPMYQTYFISDDGELWTVFIVNGNVFANPASYNLAYNTGAQLLFSESNTLTSYNDSVNKFYYTIPYETAVVVKTVEKINAETLNKMTAEEISK